MCCRAESAWLAEHGCCAGSSVPGSAATMPMVTDSEGQCSAILLRDVHCALLRAIENKGLQVCRSLLDHTSTVQHIAPYMLHWPTVQAIRTGQ